MADRILMDPDTTRAAHGPSGCPARVSEPPSEAWGLSPRGARPDDRSRAGHAAPNDRRVTVRSLSVRVSAACVVTTDVSCFSCTMSCVGARGGPTGLEIHSEIHSSVPLPAPARPITHTTDTLVSAGAWAWRRATPGPAPTRSPNAYQTATPTCHKAKPGGQPAAAAPARPASPLTQATQPTSSPGYLSTVGSRNLCSSDLKRNAWR